MTIIESPWAQIKVPDSDYAVRKADVAGAVPIYWGRDSAGRYILIIELDGDYAEQFSKAETSVRGIRVDLRRLGSASEQGLVISLEEQENSDLFLGLCKTMISSLQSVEDSATALSLAMTHIKRWKAFLSGKKSRLLTPEEIRGLFGELRFLQYLYSTHYDVSTALDSWVGPEGAHQDFQIEDVAVEVKSLSGRERNSVRISSEDQLEAVTEELFLFTYGLRELPKSDSAKSLNELVYEVSSDFKDPELVAVLEQRLAAVGYVEMKEYDQPKLVVVSERAFKIGPNFPRLVRSAIPDGLAEVNYEIQMEKIEPFECDPDIFQRTEGV